VNNLASQREKGRSRAATYYREHREAILAKSKRDYLKSLCDGNALLAFERDGWKCQRCGVHWNSRRLIPHHKDGKGMSSACPNHELDNLETLCVSCHPVEHYGRGDIPPPPFRGSLL
jgi:ribosomal protein L37AE/L43A